MKTVKNIENMIIINKSKFITNLFYVETINDVEKYLKLIKDKYKDATHNCYAYIIDNTKRFNDDGEPNGTAGMPILEVLEKNNLNHVLAIVTRYFGGIKLGAGGLLRAYTKSITTALMNTNIFDLTNGYLAKITFDYNREKELNKLLDKYTILKKIYDSNITYLVEIDDIILNKLDIDVEIIKNINIKK